MEVLDSVLLVDDDEAANFLHKTLITQLGIAKDVVETKNGREAFEYIQHSYRSLRQLPSLVLVDISMPVMNGIELIKELSGSDMLAVNKIPLAVVTSSDSTKDHTTVRSLGNFKYIPKPLDENKIFDILYSEVMPNLFSPHKKNYINERHRELEMRLSFLREQHKYLEQRREEIKKYTDEVRDKINKLRKDSGETN